MQRLFSTFPDGWPGFGLLLLRFGLGICVIYIGSVNAFGKYSEPINLAQSFIASAAGLLLLAGLWTPIIGTLLVLDEVWIAISLYLSHQTYVAVPVFLAILSTSVAMLGPGAWSIDARLFGRRRFPSDRRGGTRPSS